MSSFIRLRGLPWSVTHQEVLDFLQNVNVVNGTKGIQMVVSRWDGKNTGEAFVHLASEEDETEALKLNKNMIGHRYIEIFTATTEEAEQAFKNPTSAPSNVVKLRGLPYSINEEMIEKFFDGLEIKRNGILICMDRRGRVSGEAYVQFENDDDTEQALLRNKEEIGHRYIEIFRSSYAEMRRHTNNRPGPYDVKDRGGFRNNNRDDFGGNSGFGGNNRNGGFGGNNNNNKQMGMNNSGGGGGFNQGGGGGFGMFGGGNGGGGGGMGSGGFGNNNSGNNFNRPMNNNNNMGMGNNSSGGGYNGGGGIFNQGSNWNSNNMMNRNMGGPNNGMGQSFGGNNNRGFNNNGGNNNSFNRGGNNRMGMGGGGSGNGGNVGGGNGFNNMSMALSNNNFGNNNDFQSDNENDDLFCIHMRGLPYNTFENEVCKFFQPIRPENVKIIFNNKGLHSGTADAYFGSFEDAQLAMKKHKEQIGNRYIELFFDGKGGANRTGGGGGGGKSRPNNNQNF